MYNDKTTLITLTELKELSPMSVNVDDDKLINSLLLTQDQYIQPALGVELYNELVDQVANSTETAANLILLNGNSYAFGGVRVTLAWFAYWKSLMYVNYSVTRKGLVKKADANSETITTDDFNIIRSDALNCAEGYLRNLIDYLQLDAESNTPVYPLYKASMLDGEVTEPTTSSSGFVL
jgi:hypothetical protein